MSCPRLLPASRFLSLQHQLQKLPTSPLLLPPPQKPLATTHHQHTFKMNPGGDPEWLTQILADMSSPTENQNDPGLVGNQVSGGSQNPPMLPTVRPFDNS